MARWRPGLDPAQLRIVYSSHLNPRYVPFAQQEPQRPNAKSNFHRSYSLFEAFDDCVQCLDGCECERIATYTRISQYGHNVVLYCGFHILTAIAPWRQCGHWQSATCSTTTINTKLNPIDRSTCQVPHHSIARSTFPPFPAFLTAPKYPILPLNDPHLSLSFPSLPHRSQISHPSIE